ncbi:MAG TPA: choice-of-anchor D domain-containing protein [Vulgatibacter sp.]|nr:choice-of-anchor D domain-containing protein [Vulgatibacter sp.]
MRAFACTIAVLIFAACGEGDHLRAVRGAIEVSPAMLSFGSVIVGLERTLPIIVRNEGSTEGRVEVSVDTPEFHVYPRSVLIRPGETIEMNAVFQPQSVGSTQATAVFHFANAATKQVVSFEGRGVEDAIQVLETDIDFGAVIIGKNETRSIAATNLMEQEIQVQTKIMESGFLPERATVGIGSRRKLALPVTFSPLERKEYLAHMRIRGCERCQWRLVTLRGTGARRILEASREDVDFGAALPGFSREATVILTNAGDVPISFGGISLDGNGASSFEVRLVDPPEALEVGASIELRASFSPMELGTFTANLLIAAEDGDVLARIGLSGVGGGPMLEVTPAVLDFGLQPPGKMVAKTVLLENNTHPENIVIKGVAIQGADVDSFSVEFDGSPITVGREPIELTVWFTPRRGGELDGFLVLHTDSLDIPTVSVTLRGESVSNAECDLEISPESIRWGWIGPNSRNLKRSIQIRNSGDAPCPVWNWRLTGDGAMFFDADSPQGDFILLGVGEYVDVPIRPTLMDLRRNEVSHAALQATFGMEGVLLSVPLSAYVTGNLQEKWRDPRVAFDDTPVGRASVRSLDEAIGRSFNKYTVKFSDSSGGVFFLIQDRTPEGAKVGEYRIVMAPSVTGPQRGQIEVWVPGAPEALLVGLEGAGKPSCEDCGWPDATCPPSVTAYPGDAVSFVGGSGANECEWGIRGDRGGFSPWIWRGPQREFFLEDPASPDALGCEKIFRAASVGDFVLHNIEVRSDGRAGLCNTTFHVQSPGGLFVEVIPAEKTVDWVGVKILNGLGGPASEGESWWDDDFTCWWYRAADSTPKRITFDCRWGSQGLEPDPEFPDFVSRRGEPPLAYWVNVPNPSLSHSYHLGLRVSGGWPTPYSPRVRVFCGDTIEWEGDTSPSLVNDLVVLGEVRFSTPVSCTFVPDLITEFPWYKP